MRGWESMVVSMEDSESNVGVDSGSNELGKLLLNEGVGRLRFVYN